MDWNLYSSFKYVIMLIDNFEFITMQTFEKHLNPLYKDIDELSNFSNVIPESELEKEEYKHLEKVTHITQKTLKFLLPQLKRLEEDLERQIEEINAEKDADSKKDARNVYNSILKQIQIMVGRINNELIAFDSPYFGKIVFQQEDSQSRNPLQLYIGKFAMIDKETHVPLITDWRSPIANIYYQNSGPTKNVSFKAPVGTKKGDLLQKRQFQIARARINGIYDAKSGNAAADEFLLAQLQERIGKKLQDVVSTIQAQQNEIIRGEINKPALMQGVAGSGKTTILLHRLAYLFYTYPKEINDTNTLIIAPNQMFIDYVSDVLPNLGVNKVDTLTYLFWGKKALGWDQYYTISPEDENLEMKEYKGSLDFIKVLDQHFIEFEKTLLENIPSTLKYDIEKRYYELKEQYKDINTTERVGLAVEYALAQKVFRRYRSGKIDTRENDEAKINSKIEAYIRKNCNAYEMYKGLFKTDLVSKELKKYSLNGLKHNGRIHTFRAEDLAPMVYLHFKLNGSKFEEKAYVMVDEAQDISLIQLLTLLIIAKNGNITLAGDLAQSIIPPFYIKDWNDVKDLVKSVTGSDTEYFELQKCYRTTFEIVEYANSIFKETFPKSYKLPEAILRHGDDVGIIENEKNIQDLDEKEVKSFVELIKQDFNKGAVTIALLARNKNHAIDLFNTLSKYTDELGRDIINYSDNNYTNGLLILPIENAKGLEFDTIFLADINSDFYGDDTLSSKLLYVALTRALHRAYIIVKKGDNFSKKFLNNEL